METIFSRQTIAFGGATASPTLVVAGGADQAARCPGGIAAHQATRRSVHDDRAWAGRRNPTVIREGNSRRRAYDRYRTVAGKADTARRARGQRDDASAVAARLPVRAGSATGAASRRIGPGQHRPSTGRAEHEEGENGAQNRPSKTEMRVRCGCHGGLPELTPSPRDGAIGADSATRGPPDRLDPRAKALLDCLGFVDEGRPTFMASAFPARLLAIALGLGSVVACDQPSQGSHRDASPIAEEGVLALLGAPTTLDASACPPVPAVR